MCSDVPHTRCLIIIIIVLKIIISLVGFIESQCSVDTESRLLSLVSLVVSTQVKINVTANTEMNVYNMMKKQLHLKNA
jgi:hypothetical protein